MPPTNQPQLSRLHPRQRAMRTPTSSPTTPGAPSLPCCRGLPRWRKRTAPAPWIWRTSSPFSCGLPKKGRMSSRPKPHISAIAPRARKPGCCVSTMKSSIPFFKRRTGSSGTRHGKKRPSIETVARFGNSFRGCRDRGPTTTPSPLALTPCDLAHHRTMRRLLAALTTCFLSAAPAAAMVGGATLADAAIARHVVLIVGGHSLCSGVVIAPDLVLTAAHCVLENGKYRLVSFDGHRAAVRDVARVVPHPQFSPSVDAPDLALVKLATQPPPKLIPAAFSDRRAPPSVGERFLVAGFGVATQGARKSAGTLRAATLVVTDRPSSQHLSLVDPNKLGASAGLGVCNGDS